MVVYQLCISFNFQLSSYYRNCDQLLIAQAKEDVILPPWAEEWYGVSNKVLCKRTSTVRNLRTIYGHI